MNPILNLAEAISPPLFVQLRLNLAEFNIWCTYRGGEFASDDFNLFCEENWIEAMADELKSITRTKIWELIDRPTGSEKKGEEDRIYVLHKALYELRQVSYICNLCVYVLYKAF